MVFEVALFNGAALAMGTLGSPLLAAHQIAITIPSITFMVPLGIGLAATVRVGMAAGEQATTSPRAAPAYLANGMAAVFVCAMALVMLLWPREIATLWLPDIPANADVLAPPLFPSLAASFRLGCRGFQLMDGIQVAASMSLRGLIDTSGPTWLAGASYWLVGAPVALLLGFTFEMEGMGIWIGLAIGLLVAVLTLTARFTILSKKPL